MKNHHTSAGLVLIVLVALTSMSLTSSAQCKSFEKQQISNLLPYVFNGKSSTILMPGDHSELSLVFYSGNTYRIIMRSAESHGNISFTIKDANNKLLFKSTSVQKADYYDFTSESTQQLTIEMISADKETDSEASQSQCVLVLVGQKEL